MTVFQVSLSGNDANDGLSAASAFRTLEAAQTAMRVSAGEDETQVHQGTYRQTGLL